MNLIKNLTNAKYKKDMGLLNMTHDFFALYVKELLKNEEKSILIVTPNGLDARNIFKSFVSDDVLLFEDDNLSYSNNAYKSPELMVDRITILFDLLEKKNRIIVTDLNGYLKKLPEVNSFENSFIDLKINKCIERSDLINRLIYLGYERTSFVSKMGDFSVRGYIIDLFPPNTNDPVRVEFFDDSIESIRSFDLDTQKSISNLDSIKIIPFNEIIGNKSNTIYSYMNDPIVIYKDYKQLQFAQNKFFEESVDSEIDINNYYCTLSEIIVKDKMYYFDFDDISNMNLSDIKDYNSISVPCFNSNLLEINKFFSKTLLDDKTIILCLETKNVNDFLEHINYSYVFTDFNNIVEGKINIISFRITSGFEVGSYIFLTDYELFNKKSIVYKKVRFKNTTKISNLSKLDVGDYVVHSLNGIGIYNGIKTLKKNGISADYLEIIYAGDDKLYIPVSKIEYISKYVGKDGYTPKINALNSTSWIKAKNRIRNKIKIEAERLIKVAAEREVKKGFSFSKDGPMQAMFESDFMYTLTPDQERAINEIKADMENNTPMDRILCGDVGYGKTEVAFRAMFKAVLDGKQVLYLCPTTFLCRQQYDVAVNRFKNYPFNIGVLNRFVSIKETKELLEKLKNGEIDILFATHRGLSSDVVFKDLGLFVVDEEQRFGVVQKEKIKQMKSNIDILTLTATPIPRTLQMAILGIRDLSLIETPPKNRKAIMTYITPFDKKMVREIIYKEVSRGGQVFILYNNIIDIESKVNMFRNLMPDVKIDFAHGKMRKDKFEKVMDDFVNHKFDVLVCTTIIETGVDIPSVNSLIIMESNRFGLGQLYQIRGRVGRSDVLAYAYLMYDKGSVLTEKAMKRLKVIKEFNSLGSGFSIAAKDLSIRGAGDILGSDQAGFIDTVGIDLYMKMLNEEVERLKGNEVNSKEDDLNLFISSHIKDEYVKDEDVKIEIHKLINSIKSEKDLLDIKRQLIDRFGKIDFDLEVYLEEELFQIYCKKLGISKVIDNNKYREIVIPINDNFNYEDLFLKSLTINNSFKISYKNKKLIISLFYSKSKNKHVVFDYNRLLKELL